MNSLLQQYASASGITVFGAHFSFIYNLTFGKQKKSVISSRTVAHLHTHARKCSTERGRGRAKLPQRSPIVGSPVLVLSLECFLFLLAFFACRPALRFSLRFSPTDIRRPPKRSVVSVPPQNSEELTSPGQRTLRIRVTDSRIRICNTVTVSAYSRLCVSVSVCGGYSMWLSQVNYSKKKKTKKTKKV